MGDTVWYDIWNILGIAAIVICAAFVIACVAYIAWAALFAPKKAEQIQQTSQITSNNAQQAAARNTQQITQSISSSNIGFNGSTTKPAQQLANQMSQRGWTQESVRTLVDNPHTTRAAVNRATGNSATAFFNSQGHHVIVDNITREVVQVSNIFDPNWIPDSSIINPFIP